MHLNCRFVFNDSPAQRTFADAQEVANGDSERAHVSEVILTAELANSRAALGGEFFNGSL